MSRLRTESNIETLRLHALTLESEVTSLMRRNAVLMKELNAAKGGTAEQLELEVAKANQELARLRKKLYGDSSEKKPKWRSGGKKNKARKGHGRTEQPDLPITKEVHELPEAERVCDACGGALEAWKEQFEESTEITVLVREFSYKTHQRQKYRCACGGCIKTAPPPRKLFAGAHYAIEFAVEVAVGKYADHLPLARQVKGMGRQGLRVTSQTLWDQIEALAKHLRPAHERLHQHVLQQPVIGVDETHWRLLSDKTPGGSTKRWQVWAVVCNHAVSYRLLPSRSADAAAEVLQGFSQTLICDGYGAYEALKKRGGAFRLAHCWAHVRRKFVELEPIHPELAGTVLEHIGQLYALERELKDRPPEERLEARRLRSKPIIDRIRKWSFEVECLPQSPLRKAINYMGSCWNGLLVFLDDPLVGLDNNPTERALRGVVLGRKNHYGSRSERGTEVAALLYSLVESCKLAGVNPATYLRDAVHAAIDGHRIPLPHELSPNAN